MAVRDTPALRARVAAELASADPRRRWAAAYALSQVEAAPMDAVPVLLEAMGAADGDLRWASARLLTRAMARAPEVARAIEGLVQSPSPLARKMALYCLRDAGEPTTARGGIVAALADADAAVRMAAMAAAAVLLPPDGPVADRIAALVDDDPDAGVRRAAAATLGRLAVRTAPVVAVLTRASASDDVALARAAGQALSRLDARAPARS